MHCEPHLLIVYLSYVRLHPNTPLQSTPKKFYKEVRKKLVFCLRRRVKNNMNYESVTTRYSVKVDGVDKIVLIRRQCQIDIGAAATKWPPPVIFGQVDRSQSLSCD